MGLLTPGEDWPFADPWHLAVAAGVVAAASRQLGRILRWG